MKKNRFQVAVDIETELRSLKTKQKDRERLIASLTAKMTKLKKKDPSDDHVWGINSRIQEIKSQHGRAQARVASLVAKQREIQGELDQLGSGDARRTRAHRRAHRNFSRALRHNEVLMDSMSQKEVRLRRQDESASSSKYDLFISHATEDKAEIARPLAELLTQNGLGVWYDEFSLSIGDSLRASIDHGLAESSFGLVVLSSHFFAKNWTQYELNGLVSKEMEGTKVILPIWHKVTKDDVLRYSPSLADKVALNTSLFTISQIAERITRAVREA